LVLRLEARIVFRSALSNHSDAPVVCRDALVVYRDAPGSLMASCVVRALGAAHCDLDVADV
jgi:hypothetical protein